MKARSADFWSGLVLSGLGAYIIVAASRWEYVGQDGPGPGGTVCELVPKGRYKKAGAAKKKAKSKR